MTGYASASSPPLNSRGWQPLGAGCHRGIALGQRPLSRPGLSHARRIARPGAALRELLTAAFRRGKIELRINTQRDAKAPGRSPARAAEPPGRLESTVQGWLPKAQPLSVHEACSGARAARPAERLDEATLDAAKRCVAGLAEARAREGEKLVAILMERIARLRELADRPSRWCRPSCSASSSASWNAGRRRWPHRRRADRSAGSAAGTRAERGRGLRDPHRRGRRIGAPACHLDEIDAPAEGWRRSRQAAGFPDPGTAARSQHPGLQVRGAGADQYLGRDEGAAIEQMREQVQNIE
jgi:hypothetical protein